MPATTMLRCTKMERFFTAGHSPSPMPPPVRTCKPSRGCQWHRNKSLEFLFNISRHRNKLTQQKHHSNERCDHVEWETLHLACNVIESRLRLAENVKQWGDVDGVFRLLKWTWAEAVTVLLLYQWTKSPFNSVTMQFIVNAKNNWTAPAAS